MFQITPLSSETQPGRLAGSAGTANDLAMTLFARARADNIKKLRKGSALPQNSQLPLLFVDLKTKQACIKDGILKHIQTILAHGIH
jgi:hypothetical protein